VNGIAAAPPLPYLPHFTVLKGRAPGLPERQTLALWNVEATDGFDQLDYLQLAVGQDPLRAGLIVSSRRRERATSEESEVEGPALLVPVAKLALLGTDPRAIDPVHDDPMAVIASLARALAGGQHPWQASTMVVDGVVAGCQLLTWTSGWLSVASYAGTAVAVLGHGVERSTVALSRVPAEELRALTRERQP